MQLFEQLDKDLTAARKERTNKVLIEILRNVVSHYQVAAKNEQRPVNEADAKKAVTFYLKGARETIGQMVQKSMMGDPRFDVARQEVQILESYLPKQIGDPELLDAIRAIGGSNIGMVMKGLKAKYGDQFDASRAKELFLKDTSGA
jgi:uncharacterized protein YqeY